MARKRRRKSSSKRRHAKRAHAGATKRRRRRRAHARNPMPHRRRRRSSGHKRSHARRRAHARNPSRRRRRSHRRNPMSPYLAAVGAMGLGLIVATVEGVAPVLAFPTDATKQSYVRYGLGGLGTLGGIVLAKSHPFLGLAIGLPSFAMLAGGPVSAWVSKLLAPSTTPTTAPAATAPAATQSGLVRQLGALVSRGGPPALGAVYSNSMGKLARNGGPPALAAVYDNAMGAVYDNAMGDVLSTPPWAQATPYG